VRFRYQLLWPACRACLQGRRSQWHALCRHGIPARLGREITGLVLSWAFSVLGAHRVELEVLASNSRAINCYRACGFRQEGIRREAGLYPDGWKDLILMGVLQSEYLSKPKTARAAESGTARSPRQAVEDGEAGEAARTRTRAGWPGTPRAAVDTARSGTRSGRVPSQGQRGRWKPS